MKITLSNSGDLRLWRRFIRGVLTVALAFLLSASLLRFAPGWNIDEVDLDKRFSTVTLQELRQERELKRGLLRFYSDFLRGVLVGDFGVSELFGRPVRELIVERADLTIHSVASGLLMGWALALVAAIATSSSTACIATATAMSVSGALLSFPSGLFAVMSLVLHLSPAWAIAAVVFPRAFPHVHEQLRSQFRTTHVVMARGRGISGFQLFNRHVFPGALPAILAVAGATVPIAFGAAIPIESLADSPGLGQLAWRATLARDLPLLVSLTLLLTLLSVTTNFIADLGLAFVRGHRR